MAKILLVEDDNNLREIYEARMLAEGYIVVTASDGEAALAVAAKEKPDLIISDVMMPKISGFEMLDILRNTEGLQETKVIMLTALGQAEDKTRADSLGADKYLVKSQVTLEDIVNTARSLLGGGDTTATPAAAPAPDLPAAADPSPDMPAPVGTPTPQPVAAMPVAEPPAATPQTPVPAAPTTQPAVTPAPAVGPPQTQASVPAPTPVVPVATPPPPQPATTAAAPSTTSTAPVVPPMNTPQPAAASSAPPAAATPTPPAPVTAPVQAPSATATPTTPTVQTPQPQAPAAAVPQPAPTATPTPAAPADAKAIDDKVVSNAVEQLLANADQAFNEAQKPAVAAQPQSPKAPSTPVPAAENTTQVRNDPPEAVTSISGDNVSVAGKKVITPITQHETKPTLDELLAKENSSAPSMPKPEPSAIDKTPAFMPPQPGASVTPQQKDNFDPNSISL